MAVVLGVGVRVGARDAAPRNRCVCLAGLCLPVFLPCYPVMGSLLRGHKASDAAAGEVSVTRYQICAVS